ncbi:Hypothetical protein, putative, partial [Bodo saltans]
HFVLSPYNVLHTHSPLPLFAVSSHLRFHVPRLRTCPLHPVARDAEEDCARDGETTTHPHGGASRVVPVGRQLRPDPGRAHARPADVLLRRHVALTDHPPLSPRRRMLRLSRVQVRPRG